MNQSNLSALVDAIRSAGYHVSTTVMVSHCVLQDATAISNMLLFLRSFFFFLNKSLCLLPLYYNEISVCCSSSLFLLQVTENQKQIVITDGGEELSFDGSGGEQHIVYGDAEQVC